MNRTVKLKLYKVKAVIFDLDGTLIDTKEADIYSLIDALKMNNLYIDYEKAKFVFGKRDEDFLQETFPFLSLEQIKRIVMLKQQLFLSKFKKLIKLHRGAYELLSWLKSLGKIIIIVTTSPKSLAQELVHKTHLDKYIDLLVTANDVKHLKPHPEPILYALNKFNLKAQDTLMIGDSVTDVIVAKKLNIKIIAVATGVNSVYELKREGADAVFNDLHSLMKYLKEN